MNLCDTMIHIDEPLESAARTNIEERMRAEPGVVSPHFGSGRDHLLLVAYDPDVTSSTLLLGRVQEMGYHAQLIGL